MEYTPKQEDLSNIQDLIGGLDKTIDPPESLSLANLQQLDSSAYESESTPETAIKRKEILDFGDKGFLLESVLSRDECLHYMGVGEKVGFSDIPDVKQSYRKSQRIVFESKGLASGLWNRISKFLKPITIDGDPHDIHIHGFASMLQGTWMPMGLNPVFRLCRYEPGGHFAPHYDGHLVSTSSCRSLQTFMLYLNASPDFCQGSTNFVDESQALYTDESGKYCAEEKNILCRIDPEVGLAIIFNHHRLHEGQSVKDGVKYILRTDIMFSKSDDSPGLDPVEEEALQLVQQAERLEALGQNMEAMKLYRRAFKLSPSLEKSY